MIAEHGDYLFLGFAYLGVGIIVWILVRPRKHRVHPISVVILPLGNLRKMFPI
jgi:hypothetical protein